MTFHRNLFLVDQYLTGATGHHLFYNRAIADAAAELDVQVTVVAGKGLREELLAPYDVLRIFRPDWRAVPPAWLRGSPKALQVLDRLALHRFRSDLRQGFSRTVFHRHDVVFGQMITPRHLAAWLEWIAALPAGKAPILAVHVAYDPTRFLAHPRLQRAFCMFRKSIHNGRLIPVTDTARLAPVYGELLGGDVLVLPHVVNPDIEKVSAVPDDSPPVFGVLGNPRVEKGFAEVVQAIMAISARQSPPRFIVVASHPDAGSEEWVQKLRDARLPNVEIVDELFDDGAEYLRMLGRISVLLLPYHLSVYGVRTSGVFCEALAAGRPVVVSEGSWMSEKASDRAACLRVRERDSESLAAAIGQASVEIRTLSAKARHGAPMFREEFSARDFVSRLMEAAND